MSQDIVLRLDTTELDRDLEETQDDVSRANVAMISTIRQTAQAGILVLQVAGVAIDQIFTLFIEGLLVGIEVSTAIAAGTFGITQVFQIGQLIAMIILIRQIRNKQTAAAQQTNAAVQLLRMGTFRFIVGPIMIIVKVVTVVIEVVI